MTRNHKKFCIGLFVFAKDVYDAVILKFKREHRGSDFFFLDFLHHLCPGSA